MAGKKIIQNAFEQILETGKDMTKSSAKQIQETLSPWDMIRNSFDGRPTENQDSSHSPDREKSNKHTPLNFDKLHKSYEEQDKQKVEVMKQRLFQLVKREDEKSVQMGQQKKAEKERQINQEEMDKRRKEEEKRKQQSAAIPQGKMKGKRKKPAEPQPAETKPNSSKQ